MPSLSEYLLVSQERVCLVHFVRRGAEWVFSDATSLARSLILPSLDCELPLAEVYDGAGLPEAPPPRPEAAPLRP